MIHVPVAGVGPHLEDHRTELTEEPGLAIVKRLAEGGLELGGHRVRFAGAAIGDAAIGGTVHMVGHRDQHGEIALLGEDSLQRLPDESFLQLLADQIGGVIAPADEPKAGGLAPAADHPDPVAKPIAGQPGRLGHNQLVFPALDELMEQEQLSAGVLEFEEDPMEQRHRGWSADQGQRQRSLGGQEPLTLQEHPGKFAGEIPREDGRAGVGPAGDQLEARPERRPFQPGAPEQRQAILG